MSFRSPLGHARGLGSAKQGTHHWWVQRLTSVALIPLVLWLVVALLCRVGADHAAVVAWIQSPIVTALLLALVIAVFYHLQLGMQVVLEDYVHSAGLQVTAQILLRLGSGFLALIAIVSILRISFGSP